MRGEAPTTEIARNKDAQGFEQNLDVAVEGGAVAGNASAVSGAEIRAERQQHGKFQGDPGCGKQETD